MPRRCVDLGRAGLECRARAGIRAHAALASLALLAACSSAPPLPPIETYPSSRSSAQPASQSSPPSDDRTTQSASESQTTPQGTLAPLTLDSGAVVPPAVQQQFDAAVALAQSGDVTAAEKAFDSLNAQYPNYSGPLVNLAILRAKAGKLEAAEQALQAAIERNPSSAPAFNHLGIVYRRLGRFKDADGAYQRAVELDPNYANAYLNLGVLCDLYLQQPQRALQAFERYLELLGKPDAKVSGWVSELKARIGNSRSARSNQ